jgi:hypothetical protein
MMMRNPLILWLGIAAVLLVLAAPGVGYACPS